MAHQPALNRRPALQVDGGRYYGVDPFARVRFRVKPLRYDWSTLTTQGVIPGWNMQALPKRLHPLRWESEAQERATRHYRQMLDAAFSQDQEARDRRLMRDWPDSVIGSASWLRELERRRAGEQPSLFHRPWTEEEVQQRGFGPSLTDSLKPKYEDMP